MHIFNTQILWDFPGGIVGLTLTLLLATAAIIYSYRHTLHKLSTRGRVLLIAIRMLVLLLLLFCLVNPRTESTSTQSKDIQKKIAVIFDNSTSMHLKGYYDKTRINDAVTYWQNLCEANNADYFKFSSQLQSIDNPQSLPRDNAEVKQTHLYENITKWCAQLKDYTDIVCFTDGIDTTKQLDTSAISALENSSSKHIFFKVDTKLASKETIIIDRIETLTKAPIAAEVALTAIIRYSNIPTNRQLTVRITDNNNKTIHTQTIKRSFDSGSEIIRTTLPPTLAGTHLYHLQILSGSKPVTKARWSLYRYVPQNKFRILLYQGALDWGTRFLKYTFAGNKFELTVRFAPSLLTRNFKGKDSAFPTQQQLAKYDAVILLNLNHEQTDSVMENKLRNFIKAGGGVLFISGNPMVAKEFANSQIEKLLPVVFQKNYNSKKRYDTYTQNYLNTVKSQGKRVNRALNRRFWQRKEKKLSVAPLKNFTLTREGQQSPLFIHPQSKKLIIPAFEDYAFVKELKPGATALAYYTDKSNIKNILMAVQRFGFGRSAVLVTDPLWRWRLSLPSENNNFETFWHNLIAWLAAGKDRTSGWSLPSVYLQADTPVTAEYNTANTELTTLKFYLKQGTDIKSITPTRTIDKKKFIFDINTGSTSSKLELIAERAGADDNIITTTAHCTVNLTPHNKELQMLKPNLAFFKNVNTLTNARTFTLDPTLTFNQLFPRRKVSLTKTTIHLLWYNTWIFTALVGLFCLELILRRVCKLV